jgi:hypothetical protein
MVIARLGAPASAGPKRRRASHLCLNTRQFADQITYHGSAWVERSNEAENEAEPGIASRFGNGRVRIGFKNNDIISLIKCNQGKFRGGGRVKNGKMRFKLAMTRAFSNGFREHFSSQKFSGGVILLMASCQAV